MDFVAGNDERLEFRDAIYGRRVNRISANAKLLSSRIVWK